MKIRQHLAPTTTTRWIFPAFFHQCSIHLRIFVISSSHIPEILGSDSSRSIKFLSRSSWFCLLGGEVRITHVMYFFIPVNGCFPVGYAYSAVFTCWGTKYEIVPYILGDLTLPRPLMRLLHRHARNWWPFRQIRRCHCPYVFSGNLFQATPDTSDADHGPFEG